MKGKRKGEKLFTFYYVTLLYCIAYDIYLFNIARQTMNGE
jgi:hypothetical protein